MWAIQEELCSANRYGICGGSVSEKIQCFHELFFYVGRTLLALAMIPLYQNRGGPGICDGLRKLRLLNSCGSRSRMLQECYMQSIFFTKSLAVVLD